MPHLQTPTLSVCITTFNRAAFIGATLESIAPQVTNECEVLVLDGASTDDTERVVSDYAQRFSWLRYVRQETNKGFDRDCDRAVELAHGQYCWLMPDDDLLKPGAIAAVLATLHKVPSLLIVNIEVCDYTMSKVIQSRWINSDSDRLYGPGEMDRMFLELGHAIRYVGCVIIKRTIWLARNRQRYYDSWYMYFGVIFQERLPGNTLLIAEPCISYRLGNSHSFSPHLLDIVWFKFPSLVKTLDLSDSIKEQAATATPWRSTHELLLRRGLGQYSMTEYIHWIRPRLRSVPDKLIAIAVALLPGILVNGLIMLYYSVTSRRYRGVWSPKVVVEFMRESRFYFRNWRVFRRV